MVKPLTHTQDVDALKLALTVLGGHAVQFVAPTMAEYVPPLRLSPGQLAHTPAPVVFLNFPAAHAVQAGAPDTSE